MDFEKVRRALAAMPGAEESFPFGPDVLVYKVGGRMFALLPLEGEPARVNLKCEPDRAVVLRQRYAGVQPGYHMDKRHWNTVLLDGGLPTDELTFLLQHSWDLVVGGLKKAEREKLRGALRR
ncbi:MAG: MmcQ/YjbR family DNA-binding protein [Myxococcales bacterium]|nr:MmcQ/YjbR family DNA-binding protein [Myxococcales bacterium]